MKIQGYIKKTIERNGMSIEVGAGQVREIQADVEMLPAEQAHLLEHLEQIVDDYLAGGNQYRRARRPAPPVASPTPEAITPPQRPSPAVSAPAQPAISAPVAGGPAPASPGSPALSPEQQQARLDQLVSKMTRKADVTSAPLLTPEEHRELRRQAELELQHTGARFVVANPDLAALPDCKPPKKRGKR